MSQTAAHLVDHVIPHVPVRQWVLSLPIPLRVLLAAQPELVTPVLQVVQRVVERHLLGHTGLRSDEGQGGAVPGTTPETFPAKGIKDCLYSLLRDYGGSVTAEHGVGTEKKDYLAYCRSPEEIALMRTLKTALDPHGILNPGRVL